MDLDSSEEIEEGSLLEKLKVFISSSMSDLKAERNVLRNTLENSQLFKPIMFEQFGARPRKPREECVEEVSNCDIYLGIFHTEYSKPTVDEYKEALNNDIKPYLYVKKTSGDRRDEKLINFLNKLKEHHTLNYFDNSEELSQKVLRDLKNLAARAYKGLTGESREKQHKGGFVWRISSIPPELPNPFDVDYVTVGNLFGKPLFHFPLEFEFENNTGELISIHAQVSSKSQAITFLDNKAVKKWKILPYPHKEIVDVEPDISSYRELEVGAISGQKDNFSFPTVYRPKFGMKASNYPLFLVLNYRLEVELQSGKKIDSGKQRVEIPFESKSEEKSKKRNRN